MEDILDVYERPFNPDAPVVCMDEQPVQLVKETRKPYPVKPGAPRRVDYEYERAGTASVFMFVEPLVGWREAHIRERRTAVDFAHEIRWLLEEVYPDVDVVTLVCDNLNTHTAASLYEAFDAPTARRLARRLDIHYTPKHGSWLNIAECELSVMTRQALGGRIGCMKTLRRRLAAWHDDRNTRQRKVDWQFTAVDARIKLKSLYPEITLS